MSENLLRLSADIVAAHVAHNTASIDGVPDLIQSVYAALAQTASPTVAASLLEPAVPIKKSISPGYIVCLEDGKKLKMLKRYLRTSYGLTPAAYRTKWGLPPSYPMVAPDYTVRRSAIAKEKGLGRKPSADAEPEVQVQQIPEGKRGRKPGSKNHPRAADSAAG